MLHLHNLHIRFRSRTGEPFGAVRGIDLQVGRGKTLGVVGESGSGKSVTAMSILQLLGENALPVEGEIEFEGVDLLQLQAEALRRLRGKQIAMIFQEPMTALNPLFSCGYQVAEMLRLHEGMTKAEAKQRTIELFEKVELPRPEQIYDSYPHEISGGQKQRVMIAMAMSCQPKLLIADEPTTALDVSVQQSILQLLKRLQAETQMAMLFISHDLGVIAQVADEVAVMYQGEIVETGSVKQVFEQPQHPYTQGLIACRPNMRIRVERLPTVSDFLEQHKAKPPQLISGAEYQQRQQALAQSPVLLAIKDLKVHFEQRTAWFGPQKQIVKAVDGVSFELRKGETLGLVGESGCGKTTLGRSILRLIAPTAGEVWFEGDNILTYSPEQLRRLRKKMQLIFQDPYSSLNPKMRVGEAIQEPMRVHGLYENDNQRKQKVLEWLERVGLEPGHYGRYPHEFSGGQRQRICIARALAIEPEFVICDESVSALDVSVQAQILNLLKALQQDFGFSYLFISHDLGVVKHISDTVMVMQNGKLIEKQDAESLYLNPQQPYTRQLLTAIPQL